MQKRKKKRNTKNYKTYTNRWRLNNKLVNDQKAIPLDIQHNLKRKRKWNYVGEEVQSGGTRERVGQCALKAVGG